MPNDNAKPIYIGEETYIHTDPKDGMYESDINCAECDEQIGAWQHDTEDSTVEVFRPYWMLDEDNNYNLCEDCYKAELYRNNR